MVLMREVVGELSGESPLTSAKTEPPNCHAEKLAKNTQHSEIAKNLKLFIFMYFQCNTIERRRSTINELIRNQLRLMMGLRIWLTTF